jgi:hypothetical protein
MSRYSQTLFQNSSQHYLVMCEKTPFKILIVRSLRLVLLIPAQDLRNKPWDYLTTSFLVTPFSFV